VGQRIVVVGGYCESRASLSKLETYARTLSQDVVVFTLYEAWKMDFSDYKATLFITNSAGIIPVAQTMNSNKNNLIIAVAPPMPRSVLGLLSGVFKKSVRHLAHKSRNLDGFTQFIVHPLVNRRVELALLSWNSIRELEKLNVLFKIVVFDEDELFPLPLYSVSKTALVLKGRHNQGLLNPKVLDKAVRSILKI
jgi:hypothetical protein